MTVEATRLLKRLVQRVAGRLGERAGRNVSERRAGPENSNAGADPPRFRGRPKLVEQLAARERPAGLTGMAKKLVVPLKLGNSGGGKGLPLKADARSDDRKRDWR